MREKKSMCDTNIPSKGVERVIHIPNHVILSNSQIEKKIVVSFNLF